jgi:hypothetical protein
MGEDREMAFKEKEMIFCADCGVCAAAGVERCGVRKLVKIPDTWITVDFGKAAICETCKWERYVARKGGV